MWQTSCALLGFECWSVAYACWENSEFLFPRMPVSLTENNIILNSIYITACYRYLVFFLIYCALKNNNVLFSGTAVRVLPEENYQTHWNKISKGTCIYLKNWIQFSQASVILSINHQNIVKTVVGTLVSRSINCFNPLTSSFKEQILLTCSHTFRMKVLVRSY